jgi:hypothetical protein
VRCVAAFFARDDLTVSNGISATFERPSASGFSVLFHFCPRCGSNVYWEPRRLPDLIAIAAGSFTEPRLPQPDQSVWTKDKYDWVMLPEGMPCFEANPTSRAK